jgi:hypothetical protein
VRSFELALDLVSAGLGVCVVPALTVMVGDQVRKGVRLYAINLEHDRNWSTNYWNVDNSACWSLFGSGESSVCPCEIKLARSEVFSACGRAGGCVRNFVSSLCCVTTCTVN